MRGHSKGRTSLPQPFDEPLTHTAVLARLRMGKHNVYIVRFRLPPSKSAQHGSHQHLLPTRK